MLYVLRSFFDSLNAVNNAATKRVLTNLYELFAVSLTLKHLSHFLEVVSLTMQSANVLILQDGYLTQAHVQQLKKRQNELLATVRKDAVPIVDAWMFRCIFYALEFI